MSQFAMVQFKEDGAKYAYRTNFIDLLEGEKVVVNAGGETKKAQFVGYIEEKLLSKIPQKEILERVGEFTPRQNTSAEHDKPKKRSQAELDKMTKVFATYLRGLKISQRWATQDDIMRELRANGFNVTKANISSTISTLMERNSRILRIRKNMYIYS